MQLDEVIFDRRIYITIILIFPVFYIGSFTFGGITFDNYIKLLFLLFLFLVLITRKLEFDILAILLFLRMLKGPLAVVEEFSSIDAAIGVSRDALSFVVYLYAKNTDFRKRELILMYILIGLTIYAIPFLVGLLEAASVGYNLSIYGSREVGFVGIFQNPHGAGLTHSFVLTVLFYYALFGKNSKNINIALYFLIAIDSFVLYKSYVRTAWLCAVITFSYLFIVRMRYRGGGIVFTVGTGILLFTIFILYNDELFIDRLLDRNIYLEGTGSETADSGRLFFWVSAIEGMTKFTPLEWLIGVGRQRQMELLFSYTGLEIVGHNGLVDALVQSGIIGGFIDCIIIIAIGRNVLYYNANSFPITLKLSVYISFLVVYIFQGGYFFYFDTMLMLIVAGRLREEWCPPPPPLTG